MRRILTPTLPPFLTIFCSFPFPSFPSRPFPISFPDSQLIRVLSPSNYLAANFPSPSKYSFGRLYVSSHMPPPPSTSIPPIPRPRNLFSLLIPTPTACPPLLPPHGTFPPPTARACLSSRARARPSSAKVEQGLHPRAEGRTRPSDVIRFCLQGRHCSHRQPFDEVSGEARCHGNAETLHPVSSREGLTLAYFFPADSFYTVLICPLLRRSFSKVRRITTTLVRETKQHNKQNLNKTSSLSSGVHTHTPPHTHTVYHKPRPFFCPPLPLHDVALDRRPARGPRLALRHAACASAAS